MIIVRRVTSKDADVLLEWRNDPMTRAASLSTAPVARPSHVEWLTLTLDDPRRELYIGEREGIAIGTLRFDRAAENVSEVSITLAPAHRGRGLALPLLRAGLDAHAREVDRHEQILAHIREENAASRALFASAGFTEVDSANGVLLLALGEPSSVSGTNPS